MKTAAFVSMLCLLFGCTSAPCVVDSDCDDLNACTADRCDELRGCLHPSLKVDDHSACTVDACDTAVGVVHAAIDTDDLDPCTADSCDPKLGVSHERIDVSDANSCTIDACDAAFGVTHSRNDAACDVGAVCRGSGCSQQQATDQRGAVIISAFRAGPSAQVLVGLTNPTSSAVDLNGFVLKNARGTRAVIRSFGLLEPGQELVGGPDAGFSFDALDLTVQGDALSLYSKEGERLEDTVDFRKVVVTPNTRVAPDAFVASAGRVTRLSSAQRTAFDNDAAASWCLDEDCAAVKLSEVLMHVSTGDDGATFVELQGPGGADVSGFTIASAAATFQVPDGVRLPLDGFLVIADGTDVGTTGFGATRVQPMRDGVDVVVRRASVDGTRVQLLDALGREFDSMPLTPSTDRSWGRVNGAEGSLTPTPGVANRLSGATRSIHLSLGQPDDAETATERYLLLKPQYAVSYNGARKNPNYVAWELNAQWKGTAPRQQDFTTDPTLPQSVPQASLSDYVEPVYDRGHLCPADDRDATVQDNQATFTLTNVVPQAVHTNRGPWQLFEAYLQCLAVTEGKELFIVAGGLYEGPKKVIKAGSTVQVPSHTWKVVTVLDGRHDAAAQVTAATRTIAVVMPNDDGLVSQSAPWRAFRVAVDEVEARTGLNFNRDVAALTQAGIEARVDSASTRCVCPFGATCAYGSF